MREAILTLADARPAEPTLEALLEAVAVATHVPCKQLMGDRRWASYARARHIYFYVGRQFTSVTWKAIGRLVQRDHSTVTHGYYKVQRNPAAFEPELSRVLAQFQDLKEAA